MEFHYIFHLHVAQIECKYTLTLLDHSIASPLNYCNTLYFDLQNLRGVDKHEYATSIAYATLIVSLDDGDDLRAIAFKDALIVFRITCSGHQIFPQ